MKNLPSQLSVAAGAVLALALSACSSLPADNPNLTDAHAAYNAAEANPMIHDYASGEMMQARSALDRADRAYKDRDKAQHVDHLAYEAKQHVLIATSMAQRKADEQRVADANAERDHIRLEARTREADRAKMDAEQAQSQAAAAQGQAMAAQQQAEAARRDAAAAQANADDTQARNQALVILLLQELNAKQTERGMVVTMGDVLFDTGRAELKPGAMRSIQKLAELMKDDPARNLSVEGFTDSTGSPAINDALSARRAESVRQALIGEGVSGDRLMAHGYGEAYPVASNDNAAGRQMNRRVEVVLSDQNGRVTTR